MKNSFFILLTLLGGFVCTSCDFCQLCDNKSEPVPLNVLSLFKENIQYAHMEEIKKLSPFIESQNVFLKSRTITQNDFIANLNILNDKIRTKQPKLEKQINLIDQMLRGFDVPSIGIKGPIGPIFPPPSPPGCGLGHCKFLLQYESIIFPKDNSSYEFKITDTKDGTTIAESTEFRDSNNAIISSLDVTKTNFQGPANLVLIRKVANEIPQELTIQIQI